MTSPSLLKVRALVFDVFGTVVDWRGGVAREVAQIAESRGVAIDGGAFADAWRAGYQPAMRRVASGAAPWATIDVLHREILDTLLPRFGLEGLDESARAGLNFAWHRLDPWPDSAAGLHRLKRRWPIATLSNGNVSLLVDLARHGGLPWDTVLSGELIRKYKPDPAVYRMAARLLGIEDGELVLVAAHPSDLDGARAAGLMTAYVERPREYGPEQHGDPVAPGRFDWQARDFADLASQMEA
ncbi:MAG: haloacid dehalogenase type II [Caldimonas sp.]